MELLRRYSKLPYTLKLDQIRIRKPGKPPDCAVHPQPNRLERRFDQATIAQIVAEYEAGASTRVLMDTYAIGKGPVLRLLHEYGAQIRTATRLSHDQIRHAAHLYEQGMSVASIAKTMDIHPKTLYDTLKRQGVQFRSPHDRGGGAAT